MLKQKFKFFAQTSKSKLITKKSVTGKPKQLFENLLLDIARECKKSPKLRNESDKKNAKI